MKYNAVLSQISINSIKIVIQLNLDRTSTAYSDNSNWTVLNLAHVKLKTLLEKIEKHRFNCMQHTFNLIYQSFQSKY